VPIKKDIKKFCSVGLLFQEGLEKELNSTSTLFRLWDHTSVYWIARNSEHFVFTPVRIQHSTLFLRIVQT